MSICALKTLEWLSRVKSFHTVSPACTGLPPLSVRSSLAQKEGHEALVSLPACRYVVHASPILVSLGGRLTEELAIWTVNQPSPRVCPGPASVVAEKLWGDQGPVVPEGLSILVMQAHHWWMCQHKVMSAEKVVIE